MENILVIDDEEGILNLLSQALIRFGFKVDTAGNGLEGTSKFDQDAYDLVITDICMSGLDGDGVVRHIRNSHRKSIPIIGISGTPWLLQQSNFDAVLPKPFSIKVLIETIQSLSEIPVAVNFG